MPGRRVGEGEAHNSAMIDDQMKPSPGEDLRNQFQLRGFLPGRKRVVRFDDQANQPLGQELEIAVSGACGNEMRAKSVIQAGAARGIHKWRFFDCRTEQSEQPRLMFVEILCVDRDHASPSSTTIVADRRDEAHACIVRYSVEKDDPQPQVDVAFGFLIVNPPPVIVSTKSTSAFFRYWMLIGSTNNFTPCDSNT